MNNKLSSKEDIIHLIVDNLSITSNHVDNILNTYYLLTINNVKCKIKQGWKINIHKPSYIEAYLYIELYIKNKKHFLDITDRPVISKNVAGGIFKKRPSVNYIASVILN